MPFITEELWRVTAAIVPKSRMLALAAWPDACSLTLPEADEEMGWVIDLVTAIRSVRTEMNIPPGDVLVRSHW